MEKEKLYEDESYPVKVNFIELNNDTANVGIGGEPDGNIRVFIVNNGSLKVLSNGSIYSAKAGQGIIINGNASYRIVPAGNEVCGAYCLLFHPSFVVSEDDVLYDRYIKDMINGGDGVIELSSENLNDEELLDGVNRLIAANLVKKRGYELITKSILCYLWVIMLHYMDGSDENDQSLYATSQDERRVKAALEYIRENYMYVITLDDIADHIHVSRSECCRCFQKVMFRTTFDYIMEYRIYSAVRLIFKEPGNVGSMADLAIMTGFNNISYFNKIFKKYTQNTPTGFRKMIKENPEQAEKIFVRLQDSVRL